MTLLNAIYQQPLDEEWMNKLLSYDKVIIYDAYATEVGFPQCVSAKLMEKGYKGKVIVKAVPNQFVKHATVNEQKEEFGLLVNDIVKLI